MFGLVLAGAKGFSHITVPVELLNFGIDTLLTRLVTVSLLYYILHYIYTDCIAVVYMLGDIAQIIHSIWHQFWFLHLVVYVLSFQDFRILIEVSLLYSLQCNKLNLFQYNLSYIASFTKGKKKHTHTVLNNSGAIVHTVYIIVIYERNNLRLD